MTDKRIEICLSCKRETCSGGDGICDYTRTFGREKPPLIKQHRCGVAQKDTAVDFTEISRAVNRAAEKMGLSKPNFGAAK